MSCTWDSVRLVLWSVRTAFSFENVLLQSTDVIGACKKMSGISGLIPAGMLSVAVPSMMWAMRCSLLKSGLLSKTLESWT